MAPKRTLSHPRSAVEIAESIGIARQLVALADTQISKAVSDLGVARVRLAEIERELVTAGAQK